jgi:hypothetical protein
VVENSVVHGRVFKIPRILELEGQTIGHFRSIALIGKNSVKLELPGHLRIQPVAHVIHTMLHCIQPSDISSPVLVRPTPVPAA